ncbi:MAG: DNA topoisomerase I [Candidatus Micrarchaeaceae archaeon]
MNKLIIAEKPSVAYRIAASIGKGSFKHNVLGRVSYYEVKESDGGSVYIAAAAGHLFTLKQKNTAKGFPVFEIEWVPSYTVSKAAYFTKSYLDTLLAIGKRCSLFINACDYDIEGTVIGTNIIKQIINNDVNSGITTGNVKRMKFSTTTNEDLLNAYTNLNDFDSLNFEAGETRHIIDWFWGINMSRALMRALTANGIRRVISIGRVQGPALAILAKRELEIRRFISEPFWEVLLVANGTTFKNAKGAIKEKAIAEEVLEKSKSAEAFVERSKKSEYALRPYPPFNLTDLQLEASRVFGMDPSRTLAIAQTLYERALISYPRTSSQKLPSALNLPRIISDLSKNPAYSKNAEALINARRFKPAEGAKRDEAHPAIFPTGIIPKKLSADESRIYDLIVKRFMASFAEYATVEKTEVVIDAGGEKYSADGIALKRNGWIDFYAPYIKYDEKDLSGFKEGERIIPERLYMKEGKTKPPQRYTKASLIALLEKKNLGTKATRAEIVDTLFKRGYVKGPAITVTEFGLSVFSALSRYSSEILDEKMTRELEVSMDNIMLGKAHKDAVIEEAKGIIKKIIEDFKKNESAIGATLKDALSKTEKSEVLGKCPNDGGDLVIRRSKAGKIFVGCSNWPKCTVTFPLPQGRKIVPTGKVCSICHTPIVKVFYGKGKVFEMDLDPNCPSKDLWRKQHAKKGEDADTSPALEKKSM